MSRLLLISLLSYLLAFAGLSTLEGELLALALPLVVYLLASLAFGPEAIQVRAERQMETERAAHHTPVKVRLVLVNEETALEELFVEDLLPPELTIVEGEPRALVALPAGATIELSYIVRGHRGLYTFEGVRLTASDHFGLFQRQAIVPAAGRLFVTPQSPRLQRIAIRPRPTRVYAGLIPARQGGPGIAFHGLRAYLPGDPIRSVNWKAAARQPDALYTNEFEQERVADVGVILDARQRSNIYGLLEYGVQAAAALADTFLRDGNRVGLLLYGDFLDWTVPGYGKWQRERIMQSLARAHAGNSQIFDKLELLPTRLFPSRSQLILVSPLLSDDLPFLIRLRARGYPLLVVSPDPVTLEAGLLAGRPGVELAARIARIERMWLLRRLNRAGIHVVNWMIDRPLDHTLYVSLGKRPLRSHGGSP